MASDDQARPPGALDLAPRAGRADGSRGPHQHERTDGELAPPAPVLGASDPPGGPPTEALTSDPVDVEQDARNDSG